MREFTCHKSGKSFPYICNSAVCTFPNCITPSPPMTAPLQGERLINTLNNGEPGNAVTGKWTYLKPDTSSETPPRGTKFWGRLMCGDDFISAIGDDLGEKIAQLLNQQQPSPPPSDALREALEKIVALCADRQRFVMMGPRAFAEAEQIAKDALLAAPSAGSAGQAVEAHFDDCILSRDPDGEIAIDFFAGKRPGLIGLSVRKDGRISWAGNFDEAKQHGTEPHTGFGTLLYAVCNSYLESVEADPSAQAVEQASPNGFRFSDFPVQPVDQQARRHAPVIVTLLDNLGLDIDDVEGPGDWSQEQVAAVEWLRSLAHPETPNKES